MRSRWRAERGSVVAEFAVALPAVALVFAALLGGVQLGATAVRLQDAAADAARGFARGESAAVVGSHVALQVPGATVRRSGAGALECAELTVRPPSPTALLGITVTARSCAMANGA